MTSASVLAATALVALACAPPDEGGGGTPTDVDPPWDGSTEVSEHETTGDALAGESSSSGDLSFDNDDSPRAGASSSLESPLDPLLEPGCDGSLDGDCLGCYGTYLWTGAGQDPPTPFSPVPDVIHVYWDPQHSQAGRFGNQADGLRVHEAREIAKTYFAEHQSQTGSAVRFRWIGEADGDMGPCESNVNDHVEENPAFIRLTTGDVLDANGNRRGARTIPRLVPDTTQMDCAQIRFDPTWVWSTAGGEDSYDATDGSSLGGAQDFLRVLNHEVTHVMRWRHANSPAQCGGTEVEDDDTGAGNPISRRNWSFHHADKRYMLNDYGRANYDAVALRGLSASPTARWEYGVGDRVMSPVTTTDGDDLSRGYAYNFWNGQSPSAKVRLYEQGRGWSEWLIGETYHRPDVTRTTGRVVDRWLAVALSGDSPEDRLAGIRVWEKQFGPVGPSSSFLDVDTPFEHVATAYDPLADRFIVSFLEDRMRVGWRTRRAWGGAWVDDLGLPDFAVSGGADVACSAFAADDGTNCVMVYVEERGPRRNILRYRRFSFDQGAGRYAFGPQRSLGYYGNTKPSVSANPLDEDVHFTVAWDRGEDIISFRHIEKDNSISASPHATAPDGKWMRPAGLGSFAFGGIAVQDAVIAK